MQCLHLIGLCVALVACQSVPVLSPKTSLINDAPAVVQMIPLTPQPACTNNFATHNLDFSTGNHMRTIAMYASNGAGVAVNDLNGDGLLDLVFASTDGQSAIMWNRGQLNFEREPLPDINTRAANIVDVDGDGLLDIVFTHRASTSGGGVSYWHNLGNAHFAQSELSGVHALAYAMGWGRGHLFCLFRSKRVTFATGHTEFEPFGQILFRILAGSIL